MRYRVLIVAIAAALVSRNAAVAQTLFSENYDVDPTASWTLNGGPSDEEANFFFDYSTVGIPTALNSTGGTTRGLKMQANETSGIFGGLSVSPTGQDFSATANYKLTFDWWANANGPFPAGGNGSTQISTYGIQTSGTTSQWPGAVQDSIWFAGSGEGGSSADWRAYSPTAGTSYPDGNAVYAAPVAQGAQTRNTTNTYYHTEFTGYTPPAAQATLYPNQTGTTQLGAAGFKWHQVEIAKLGTDITYKVNGFLIATVPVAHDTVAGGGNIFFGHSDINFTSSTDPNADATLFTLIDNVKVEAISLINPDFNGNTIVDAADYPLWRANNTLTSGATQSQGDSDSDGDVDSTDYNNWRAAFGDNVSGAGLSAGSTVPEPSTLLLVAMGLSAWATRRGQR